MNFDYISSHPEYVIASQKKGQKRGAQFVVII